MRGPFSASPEDHHFNTLVAGGMKIPRVKVETLLPPGFNRRVDIAGKY